MKTDVDDHAEIDVTTRQTANGSTRQKEEVPLTQSDFNEPKLTESMDAFTENAEENERRHWPYNKCTKAQQYRRLKQECPTNVVLGRSLIEGLGLFSKRDIEKHTMVIEYKGLIIRNEVANRREKIYDDQRRGCYMFRIDSEQVIDATMHGGLARYINHSCDPNCVAEVVQIDKEKKIIIISKRFIKKGEELTYDYKFEFETEGSKISCNCGASCCRKWMN
ncbi:LOW QUALITY PROTEIN: histone-lysine N-methyltransferase trr-like [Oscarella lobularis]|uniref:LOW QUALITY PROTEIN: histone-lysine N-methyltransferase trr-like n=1 Tax=Oscarella lobularis TaxID=121494 RepID=UPI00331448D2